MSVNGQIERIKAAKVDLISSIAAKGIDIPASAPLEELPSYVDMIASGAIPSGYTKLSYIRSSGTQYIDTGYIPNQDTRIICDVQITDTATQHLFGARASANAGAFFVPCISATTIRADYGSQKNTHTVGSVLDRMTIDIGKTSCTIGGTSTTFTAETFSANASITLFASNTGGTVVVDTYKAKMKLFSCRIYDNGTLVRDFIPCLRDSDSRVGLYDMQNGVFYTNNGTGEFYSEQGGSNQGGGNEQVVSGSYATSVLGNYKSFAISNLSFSKVKYVAVYIGSIVVSQSSKNTITNLFLRDGANVFTQYQYSYSSTTMQSKADSNAGTASYEYSSGVLTINVPQTYEFVGRADYNYVVVGE